MAQQAQVEFYDGSRELAAMDYAAAVNEEIRDLFAAGADIVQIDEPYMQARPEEARAYGLRRSTARSKACTGTTAVHICFGYAAIIHARPSGYSFLPELAQCSCTQVSIETAQSNLDCAVLRQLAGQEDHARRDRSFGHECRDGRAGGGAHSARAAVHARPKNIIVAPDCGMKYLPREVAFGKMRAMVEGARAACGRSCSANA